MAEGENQANEIADLAVEIYAIHEAVIEESGGLPGLRDGALLHAAARPYATFAGAFPHRIRRNITLPGVLY